MSEYRPGLNPFEAPKEDTRRYEDVERGEFPRTYRRDPSGLTTALQAFLWIWLVLRGLALALDGMAYWILVNGEFDEGALKEISEREVMLGMVAVPVFLITAFLFLKWIYRMSLNAHGFGARYLTISPGWAIGWYFVPIASLWKPYQAMKQIWQASRDPAHWASVTGTGLVGIWWTFYLTSTILNQLVVALSRGVTSLDAWKTLLMFGIAAGVVSVVLGLVAIRLISRIYQMQKAWVEGWPTDEE